MAFTLRMEDTFVDTAFTAITSHTPTVMGSGYSDLDAGFLIDVFGTGLGSTNESMTRNTTSLGNDQAIELELLTDAAFVGILVRFSGTAIANYTGYLAGRDNVGDTFTLYSVLSGSPTAIAGPVAHTFTSGEVIRLQVVGTAVEVSGTTAGPIASATSSTIASGSVGLYINAGVGTISQHVWAYDDTGAAGQPTMRRWGGVPFMGGQGIGQKGSAGNSGRAWGRRKSGIIVPQRYAA